MSYSLKLCKGLGSVIVASSLVFSPALTNTNEVNAETTQTQEANEKVEIDENVGNVIYQNLGKNDEDELYIVDKDQLKNDLSSLGYEELTVKEVEKYVDNYNATIKGENGEKAKQDLLNYNKEIQENIEQNNKSGTQTRAACDALTAAGAGHTLATTGAMAALGVSGPVGWSVGAGMTVAYAGGSIACNHA